MRESFPTRLRFVFSWLIPFRRSVASKLVRRRAGAIGRAVRMEFRPTQPLRGPLHRWGLSGRQGGLTILPAEGRQGKWRIGNAPDRDRSAGPPIFARLFSRQAPGDRQLILGKLVFRTSAGWDLRAARSQMECFSTTYAARRSVTIGRCRCETRKSTCKVKRSPGWPATSVRGLAQGDFLCQFSRGSILGRRLAGRRPKYTSLGVRPPRVICGRDSLYQPVKEPSCRRPSCGCTPRRIGPAT